MIARGVYVISVVFAIGVCTGISASFTILASPYLSSRAFGASFHRVPELDTAAANPLVPPAAVAESLHQTVGSRPDWCGSLMAVPRGSPMSAPIPREALDDLCNDGAPAFFGQLNHDAYLYMHHFRHLNRSGIFLDLAANHAKRISNTYFLERCAGWTGMCVEANARYFLELKKHRSCQLIPKCVSDREETVTYMMYEGLSGISDTNKNMPQFEGKHFESVTSTNMTCVVLRDPLREAGLTKFDYLSLDLEGHELKALKGIDWKLTSFSVVSLEAPPNSSVSLFLLNMGYTIHAPLRPPHVLSSIAITGDEIYLAPGVIFGRPT
jgi:FkbM family methyltransferase